MHRFEQSRLGLGVRPVDLVGQKQVVEGRLLLEDESPVAFGRLHDDVGDGQVGGHQVRRELNTLKFEVERVGERLDQQGFAQAGHTFQLDVAACHQGDQGPFDNLLVSDDHLDDFAPERLEVVAEAVKLLLQGFGAGHSPRLLEVLKVEDPTVSRRPMDSNLV